jgi:tRNA threonylcarbamoyladenosine dehydratase
MYASTCTRWALYRVFSAEDVDQSRIIETEKAYPKKSIIGTISYMPAVFGCVVASVVIRDLYNVQ